MLRSLEVKGALVSPLLVGLETMVDLAAESDLALLPHPALAGAYFRPDHGIAPDLLLGKLFRLLGSDGVIYPNVGGRFMLDKATCQSINGALRAPWSEIKPAFPVPAGGIDLAKVSYWIDQYGPDTVFLLGSSLYRQQDLVAAAKQLVQALTRG